ncbi:MAG: hypothetical protein BGO77_00085 [Caedibacter sp. 37-49]|nr:MAG: hypothetical protein BGO77_00085 [Caedibacter sp. 37-49]
MFNFLAGAFITLFVIIDPFGVIPIFIALTRGDSKAERAKIARKATIISLVLLLGFAFVGDYLLDSLGISIPSFRIAGGILLLLAAIDMVVARHSGISSTTQDEQREALQRDDISVFPLAIPLIAGPGALVSAVILMREVEGDLLMQLGLIVVLVLVVLIMYVCLLMAEPLSKLLGVTGSNVLGRVFGIILAALAVQFIIDGLSQSVGHLFKSWDSIKIQEKTPLFGASPK